MDDDNNGKTVGRGLTDATAAVNFAVGPAKKEEIASSELDDRSCGRKKDETDESHPQIRILICGDPSLQLKTDRFRGEKHTHHVLRRGEKNHPTKLSPRAMCFRE